MRFILVNCRTPRTQSVCALCCESIGGATYEISRRISRTAITSVTSITAKFPSLHFNIMRWHHDNIVCARGAAFYRGP
jgi:hypothetical protein